MACCALDADLDRVAAADVREVDKRLDAGVPAAPLEEAEQHRHEVRARLGQRVLVAGAAAGLGQEFVKQALARGAAKVYAGARRDHDWGDSALSWLARPGAYAASKTAFWGLTNALRLELAEQKTQVVGAHLGYTDTPFIAHLDVPKSDPAVIVSHIFDALEAGEDEAIADDTSSPVKSILPSITTGVLPS